jgi:hypothetical protein
MSGNTKLPISLQLVGVTAVLVFSFSTISTIAYIEAILHQWDLINEIPKTWDGFYYPVLFPPLFCAALAVASAAMFAILVFTPRGSLAKASLVFITAMLAALAWRIYVCFPAGGANGFRLASTSAKIYFYVHVLYATWLIGLAKFVLPEDFFNWIFKNR